MSEHECQEGKTLGAGGASWIRWGFFVAWGPMIGLVAGAVGMRGRVADWVFMWAMAGAVFLGCKWVMWRKAGGSEGGGDIISNLKFGNSKKAGIRNGSSGQRLQSRWLAMPGYLFAWPGMESRPFLGRRERRGARAREWGWAVARMILGVGMVWVAVRASGGERRLAVGWLGMVGVVVFLHFGLFDLLALGWNAAGVRVKRVMQNPAASVSLAEFWGKRWNSAFNELVFRLAFRPLARKWGSIAATMGVFLISGLIHEAVITVPARGGYGLPTAYFLAQGAGVCLERSGGGKALGLGRGWRGRIFAIGMTAGPAFWLFPPVFVRNVVLPMLRAFGGI